MILSWLTSSFIFVFGLCIGSFLNVVVYRLEESKSFLKGRSFCPNCKHNLNYLDLIPIFSYLFLGGKCRYCKIKISVQYPIVEIITGLIFLLIFNKFSVVSAFPPQADQPWAGAGMTASLVFWFYIASVLIIIFVYDLKHYLIPDNVLFPAIIVAILFRVLEFLDFKNWDLSGIWNLEFWISAPLLNYFYASLIGFAFFFILWLISGGRWMGFGDVKLAILLGLILGFPNILAGLFLAFFFGAIIGVILMINKKRELKSEIPFGPFLIFGTFMALFFGEKIINLYLELIMF